MALKENEVIAELARKGATLGDCGKMCKSCAFRLNSDANVEPHNVSAAFGTVVYGGIFNCHKEKGVDKNEPCAGFLYAKKWFERLESNL